MLPLKTVYRYRDGFRDGIPVGLGYLSVSFGFGITAVRAGMRVLETLLISMTNLTSAGQVAGVTVIAAAGTLTELILCQLVINLRYALMSITLTQRLDSRCSVPHRLLMSFGITDEIFAIAASKSGQIGPSYFYGLMTAPYLGWAGGTLLGALAGRFLPERLLLALGIAIYAMFVAIVVPAARSNRGIALTAVIAAVLSCCIAFFPFFGFITEGFSVIICAVIAALLMAWLSPVGEEEEESGT